MSYLQHGDPVDSNFVTRFGYPKEMLFAFGEVGANLEAIYNIWEARGFKLMLFTAFGDPEDPNLMLFTTFGFQIHSHDLQRSDSDRNLRGKI